MTTYHDYAQLALRTEKPLPTMIGRLSHAALGMITEGGEITTEIKRIAIYGKTLDDMDKSTPPVTLRQHIAEEIGDLCWYVAIAADAIGFPDLFSSVFPQQRPVVRADFSLNQKLEIVSHTIASITGRFAHQVAHALFNDDMPTTQILRGDLYLLSQSIVTLASVADIDLEQALSVNIDKLMLRYPEAYSDAAAEARADKGGLDARVS